jgi:glycine/D-amino acid oxidase-like deaminating enzyme
MIEPSHRTARVAVVGAGHVGSTFAYALLLSGLADEIFVQMRDAADILRATIGLLGLQVV